MNRSGAPSRGRTGTPLFRKAADFKSAVSTNFTIGAPAAQRTPASQRNPGSACAQCPVVSLVTGPTPCRAARLAPPRKKGSRSFPYKYGAGKESRTLDLNLGKVALYQLSYSRIRLLHPTFPSELISKPQIISLFFGSIRLQTKKSTNYHPSFNSHLDYDDHRRSSDIKTQTVSGGAVRSRTGLTGFAIRGITALLPRQKFTFL